MKKDKVEIKVHFKESADCLCEESSDHKHPNVLTFNIQPDEGITVKFWAKKPEFSNGLIPVNLSFSYWDSTRSL